MEREPKRKRDVIKKVIAYMTLGIDVSRLFTEMVLAIETRDLVRACVRECMPACLGGAMREGAVPVGVGFD